MTLNELHARLTLILAENKALGWEDRNELPVLIEVFSPRRGVRTQFIPADSLSGAKMTVAGNHFGLTLLAQEQNAIKAGK